MTRDLRAKRSVIMKASDAMSESTIVTDYHHERSQQVSTYVECRGTRQATKTPMHSSYYLNHRRCCQESVRTLILV